MHYAEGAPPPPKFPAWCKSSAACITVLGSSDVIRGDHITLRHHNNQVMSHRKLCHPGFLVMSFKWYGYNYKIPKKALYLKPYTNIIFRNL